MGFFMDWKLQTDIVTLKVLPTSCFRYNSEEESTKLPNPKMKLNKIDTSFSVKVL